MKRHVVFFFLASAVGCGARAPAAPSRELPREGLLRACSQAVALASRQDMAGATTEASPRFAVRVKIATRSGDSAPGDGQLGLRGFRTNHSVTVFDAAGRERASVATAYDGPSPCGE